jgi:hypothetical protein
VQIAALTNDNFIAALSSPVSAGNELAVVETLERYFRAMLDAYPTALEVCPKRIPIGN